MKLALVLIQLAQPSSIKCFSELLQQGGLLSPAAGEMLNSCACPYPPASPFIEADTAAAFTSPVAYIHTNAARLNIFLFCSVMLVFHEPITHLQGAGVGGRTHQLSKHIMFKERFSRVSEEKRGSDKGLLFRPG